MRTDSSLAGVLIQETNSSGLITLGQFQGVSGSLPTTASKFAVGCMLTVSGDGKTYYNAGTEAVPSWNAVSDISASEISLARGKMLRGNPSGVAEALTVANNEVVGGDGTDVVSQAVAGDLTKSGTTWTIANNAVDADKTEELDGTTAGLYVPKRAVVVYDFSVDGGSQGAIALTGAPTIPSGYSVFVEHYVVETTCTSGTDAATITLSLPTDGALLTATAISDASNPWDEGVFPIGQTAGLLASQTPRLTSAARVPQLTVAGGEDLTAGKIVFVLVYTKII